MFVRQLIGREAGTIIELPHHAAEACLATGSVERVSDEEIAEAGLKPAPTAIVIKPDEMPPGFRAEASPAGGFDVYDAGGVNLTAEEDIPNLAAARSFAINYAGIVDGGHGVVEGEDDGGGKAPVLPADWRDLHFMKQIHLAKQFDPAVTKKDEAVAALEAAEKAAAGAAQG